MNNHPNRNWRKRWQLSGASALHTSGLLITGERSNSGLTVTVSDHLAAEGFLTPAERLAQSRAFARLCEEGLRLLLETCKPH